MFAPAPSPVEGSAHSVTSSDTPPCGRGGANPEWDVIVNYTRQLVGGACMTSSHPAGAAQFKKNGSVRSVWSLKTAEVLHGHATMRGHVMVCSTWTWGILPFWIHSLIWQFSSHDVPDCLDLHVTQTEETFLSPVRQLWTRTLIRSIWNICSCFQLVQFPVQIQTIKAQKPNGVMFVFRWASALTHVKKVQMFTHNFTQPSFWYIPTCMERGARALMPQKLKCCDITGII